MQRALLPELKTTAPDPTRRQQEPFRRDEKQQDDTGPTRPDVNQPDRERLMRRMRKVDRDQSKRYRQRTGE